MTIHLPRPWHRPTRGGAQEYRTTLPIWTLNETEADFVFAYTAARQPAEPDVGLPDPYFDIGAFEFIAATVGELTLGWADFVRLAGAAEADRIVGAAEDELRDRLAHGLEEPE